MSDSFQCPKCGARYARQRRQIGKAVVCACGHKFLVPPLDLESSPPTAPPATSSPSRSAAPRPGRPSPRRASASDSSGEVLPLAEPVEPAAPHSASPWAEPIELQEAEPLMEAEVVYPATPYAEPVMADDYGQPLAAASAHRQNQVKSHRASSVTGAGPLGFSKGVAYSVLFVLVSAAALFTILGMIQYRRANPIDAGRPSAPATADNPPNASNEPATSGYPITIWNATKRASSHDFNLEYRVDRAPLDASHQYFWIVADSTKKVEFPVPASLWKPRDKLSGKPETIAPGEFTGPYTTYIEEQIGTTRSQISNEAPVTIGG